MPDTANESEERISRSTIACDACRARKQKVSASDRVSLFLDTNQLQCGGERYPISMELQDAQV